MYSLLTQRQVFIHVIYMKNKNRYFWDESELTNNKLKKIISYTKKYTKVNWKNNKLKIKKKIICKFPLRFWIAETRK